VTVDREDAMHVGTLQMV